MRSIEQLDAWISAKVKAWSSRASGAPGSGELLELRRDILGDVRDHIHPRGHGRSVFPYSRVSIQIAAENREQKLLYEAAFAEGGIDEDVRELLREADCPVPAAFSVTVAVAEDAALALSGRPFAIDYSNGSSKLAGTARPNARLRIVRGQADAAEYTIQSDRVNIGRLQEVVGAKDGLRRRNHVAFADTETTVSREHAYVRYDAESGRFRLYDPGSQRGTSVFREGRRLDVPKGVTHGLQLRSGDEIHLGDARLVFESES